MVSGIITINKGRVNIFNSRVNKNKKLKGRGLSASSENISNLEHLKKSLQSVNLNPALNQSHSGFNHSLLQKKKYIKF